MNRIQESNVPLNEKALFSINDLRNYLSLGRNNAQEVGRTAGAEVKFGSRVLYSRRKIDEYIETLQKELH